MHNNLLYRTLFLLDDTRNYTNDFYISEFVKIVLFKEGCFTLTLEEIQEKIGTLTSLEYTIDDIARSISVWNNNEILCEDSNYSLTTTGIERISKTKKSNDINQYIDLFLNTYPDKFHVTKKDFQELIEKFIYQRFNENLQQISDILNNCLEVDSFKNDYNEEEKLLINEFLNWDHDDKNKCVYKLIAKSYDYCMINSKCANSKIDFSKIVFYLDTNIIFRLLGINGTSRELSINNLIERAKTAGIKLVVSNFVEEECEYTINSQLEILIKDTTSMNNLIPPSAMGFAEEKSIRLDFYKRYYDWIRMGNNHRNYDSFKKCILKDFHKLINAFDKDDDNISFKVQKASEFENFYNSLYSHKMDRHTTETDVNSFLLLLERRKQSNEHEYFLISADQKLITWLHETFPGKKSLADFPSAWLSIILKYSGREKETDYTAFCQFIHLSIEPKIDDLEKKIEIKAGILSSDIDDDLKAMMIEEVKENYPHYQAYETKDILKIAYGKTKENIESEIEKRKDAEKDSAIAAIKSTIEKERKQNQENMDKVVASTEEEKQKSYLKGYDDAYAKFKEEQLEEKVQSTLKRNIRIRKFFNYTFWGLIISFAIVWILFYVKGFLSPQSKFAVFMQKNSLFFSGILFLLEFVVAGIKYTIKKKNFFPIDEAIIREQKENEFK